MSKKPGIPSIPTVNIDPGFIPIVKFMYCPIKLKTSNASTPIVQLKRIFNILFKGEASTAKNKMTTININMYAANVS